MSFLWRDALIYSFSCEGIIISFGASQIAAIGGFLFRRRDYIYTSDFCLKHLIVIEPMSIRIFLIWGSCVITKSSRWFLKREPHAKRQHSHYNWHLGLLGSLSGIYQSNFTTSNPYQSDVKASSLAICNAYLACQSLV